MPECSRGCFRVEMTLGQQGMFLRSQASSWFVRNQEGVQIRWFLALQGLVHQNTDLVCHTLLHWKPVQLAEQGFGGQSSTEHGRQLEQDCSGRTAVSRCCLLMSPAAASCSNPAERSPSHTRSFERRAWSVMDGCGGGHECGSCMPLQRPRLVPSSKALNPDERPGF